MSAPTLIIDSNYMCYRARYAMGKWDPRYKSNPTGTLYGFLRSTAMLMEQFRTKHVFFCFDSRYSKRKEFYPPYKAKRHTENKTEEDLQEIKDFQKQVLQLRREILPDLGFNNIFLQRGYEADDIIAALCNEIPKEKEYIIITADEDMYQCLSGRVRIYQPRTNTTITLQKFYRTFSIEPHEWILVKAIAGCKSDNIPGIFGIGEKKALEYVTGVLRGERYHKLIAEGMQTEAFRTFLKLVKLPLEGCITPRIRKDELNKLRWKMVCNSLGIQYVRFPINFKDGVL